MSSKKSGQKKYAITPRSEDHGKWYSELLVRSGMIDYTDVSGCYVLKPWAFSIWEKLRSFLNVQIAVRGVENTYFPMLVSETNLQREAEHLEDFAPEVAWITTDNDNEEEGANRERFAIRPTSETIIYPHFANWMKETGQYPKINQWCNILRWENKDCTPFIRSREFLWQEGHTCHADRKGAIDEMWDILDLYRTTYEKLLAVPMIPGVKTRSETFPGAELTTTIEGFLPESGRAIQSATSHYLGTNFSEIFDIRGGDGVLVHQNSWGFTTRSIGIAVMTHSDDRGLVLPPRIAPIQVVMVACGLSKKSPESARKEVDVKLTELQSKIREINIVRCLYDNTPKESPGMKFNKWEMKGVPLRIELGPRDLKNDQVTMVRRDTMEKWTTSLSELLNDPNLIMNSLNLIHDDMFERARAQLQNSIVLIDEEIDPTDGSESLTALTTAMSDKKLCLIRYPAENVDQYEKLLKAACKRAGQSSIKSLCIPSSDALKTYGFEHLTGESITAQYMLYGRSY
jgi:prolyl-tRNA synthetase